MTQNGCVSFFLSFFLSFRMHCRHQSSKGRSRATHCSVRLSWSLLRRERTSYRTRTTGENASRLLATQQWTTPTIYYNFFELSLRLSRAYLGKIMHFIHKWLKNPVFTHWHDMIWLVGPFRFVG